jgi:transcriptional regulator with XRE-family HTH domain
MKNTNFDKAREKLDGSPDPVDVHVGGRIRMRRILLGQSQESVAARLGVSFQQLQKYESGTNRVSASRLYDAAHILMVPISYFFDEMPEGVRHGTSETSADTVSDGIGPDDLPSQAVLQNRMTLDLIRDFYRIRSTYQQRCILDLIRALAEDKP